MNGWYLLGAFIGGFVTCWITFWLITIRDFLPGLWSDIKYQWREKNER